jgi:hypothetical protein
LPAENESSSRKMNFSVHFVKAGPMKVTGLSLTGECKHVEVDLERAK